MIWDDNLAERMIAAQNDMAPFLPSKVEVGPFGGPDAFTPGYPRQPAHTATNNASKRSSGMGRPSSSSAAT
jgi:hypothetical protein